MTERERDRESGDSICKGTMMKWSEIEVWLALACLSVLSSAPHSHAFLDKPCLASLQGHGGRKTKAPCLWGTALGTRLVVASRHVTGRRVAACGERDSQCHPAAVTGGGVSPPTSYRSRHSLSLFHSSTKLSFYSKLPPQ